MPSLPNMGDPRSEDFAKGQEVGERVPEFTLPNQLGQPVYFRPDGKSRSLLLFHRSASW